MTERPAHSKRVNPHVKPFDPTSQLDRRSRAAGETDSESELDKSEQESESHV